MKGTNLFLLFCDSVCITQIWIMYGKSVMLRKELILPFEGKDRPKSASQCPTGVL